MKSCAITGKTIDARTIKRMAIVGDKCDQVQFTISRTYDERVDLGLATWYLKWERLDGTGNLSADDLTVTVGADTVTILWAVKGNPVAVAGVVKIALCAIDEVGDTVYQTYGEDLLIDRGANPSAISTATTIWTEYLAIYQQIQSETEAARDAVLEDTGFQAVAADLLLGENSSIEKVAEKLTKVETVAESIAKVTSVADNAAKVIIVADDIVKVKAVADDIEKVKAVADNAENINGVHANKTNINTVAGATANIDLLAPQAANMATLAPQAAAIGTLAPHAAAIAALDAIKAAISALDLIKDDITGVNGAKTDVSAVAAKLTEIQAVKDKLTAIEALYGKTTEIDALYAQLGTIAEKVNISSIVNDLTTGGTTVPLSAEQGVGIGTRLTALEAHTYGLCFNETTGVSTRLLDAVGLVCGAPNGTAPITSDFSNCYPWSERRHVKVNMKGLRKEQWDIDYATFDGEMMTLTPEYWYKDYRSGGYRYMYISDKPQVGFKKRNEYLLGSFPVSRVGTEYRSRVGETPKTNVSYTTFLTGMMAQGDGRWSMYDKLHSEFLLSVIEAGTLNHKVAYGIGINASMPYGNGAEFKCTVSQTGANSIIIANAGATNMRVGMSMQIGTTYTNNSVASDRLITDISNYDASNKTITVDGAAFDSVAGTTTIVSWGQPVPQAQYDTMGDGSGYILQFDSVNRSHVCYRGVWDLWGNVWQLYAGFMRYDGLYYGCTDPTKYNVADPRTADGWTYLGVGAYAANGYQQIREGIALNNETIDVPILWGAVAGSATYYSAYLYYFDSVYTGARVLLLGGVWNYGSYVSLVYSYGNSSSSGAYVSVGSRLIRY